MSLRSTFIGEANPVLKPDSFDMGSFAAKACGISGISAYTDIESTASMGQPAPGAHVGLTQ